MKKLIFFMMSLAAVTLFVSCEQQQSKNWCRIHGTVIGPEYEGKRIFLVPLKGPATAETVDSMEVKDGKFEFMPDSPQIYKILMDYHYRYATQTLLVIAEPGDISVVIDTVSHASGTKQNDSLEAWKTVTETFRFKSGQMSKRALDARSSGNIALSDSINAELQAMRLAYKQFSRRMSANMEKGLLHDFLDEHFPLTYKRTMPDGTVVEMDVDTNEPVKK
jgi:hypothetical protein